MPRGTGTRSAASGRRLRRRPLERFPRPGGLGRDRRGHERRADPARRPGVRRHLHRSGDPGPGAAGRQLRRVAQRHRAPAHHLAPGIRCGARQPDPHAPAGRHGRGARILASLCAWNHAQLHPRALEAAVDRGDDVTRIRQARRVRGAVSRARAVHHRGPSPRSFWRHTRGAEGAAVGGLGAGPGPGAPAGDHSPGRREASDFRKTAMRSRVMVAAVVVASAAVALAWVFFVPIFEAPDETVHFEYSTALYSAGGLVAPRDAARLTIPAGRTVPDPTYLEDRSAVAVIAEKPDVKAPAGYGTGAYYDYVDRNLQRVETAVQLFNPPLLRYYPFGYYLLDAAVMGVASLFTASPVALFFAARSLSVALLMLSLVFTYLVLRRLRCEIG